MISVFLTLIVSMGGCWYDGRPFNGIVGEGPVVERSVSMRTIRGIVIQNSTDVFLRQGPEQKIRIEAQENILDNLVTDPEGDVWKIRSVKPVRHAQKIKIYITLEQLRNINISGSGDVVTENRFSNLKDLDLKISGSGSLHLDLEADDIIGRISGSGSIRLEGEADELDLSVSGSGNILANKLLADRAITRIGGSGSIKIWVSDRLDARISGSGNILYRGNPTVNSSISGSGRISSL